MNVRSRFNTKFSGFENDHVAVAAFVFAVEPLVKYLISSTSLAYLKTQGRTATALHVHELFMIISARTRITKKFRAVLDSDDNWNGVEAGIQIILGGTKVAAPARDDDDREVREWHPSRVLHPPWWATRRVVSLFLLTLSPIVFYCRQIFETGRYRFCCSMLSLFFFIVSGFYLFKGPAVLPGVVLSLADALDADEEEDDAPSEVSEASDPWAAPKPDPAVASTPPRPSAPPPDIESPAVAKISAEMTELREMMQAMMGSPHSRQELREVLRHQGQRRRHRRLRRRSMRCLDSPTTRCRPAQSLILRLRSWQHRAWSLLWTVPRFHQECRNLLARHREIRQYPTPQPHRRARRVGLQLCRDRSQQIKPVSWSSCSTSGKASVASMPIGESTSDRMSQRSRSTTATKLT